MVRLGEVLGLKSETGPQINGVPLVFQDWKRCQTVSTMKSMRNPKQVVGRPSRELKVDAGKKKTYSEHF